MNVSFSVDLLDVPKFGKVKEHIQTHREEWFQFLTSSNAEYHIPQVIERNLNEPTPSGKYQRELFVKMEY
jgi:hypothetical protein